MTIYEICVNPRDATVFEAIYNHLFGKKSFLDMGRAVCVPNLRSLSYFVWSGGFTQTDTKYIKNKAVGEICGKFSRLVVLRVTFSKNKKGECVYQM